MEHTFRTFATLITGIYKSIRRIKAETMSEFHLKSPHVSSIYYLYRAKSMTVSQLSEASGEDKANVSRIIAYLEQNGFLSRDSENRKHYRVALSLTEKGREVGRRLCEKLDKLLQDASRGLSEESQKELFRCLSLIDKNLSGLVDGEG